MSADEATREQVRDCLDHLMWGTIAVGAEFVECSCGWRWETVFADHCAITDIAVHGNHARYVIAYPETEDHFASMIVIHDGEERSMSMTDLAWLLEQPNVPDSFRRAAAVHVQR